MTYMIPQKRYNETIENLSIEQNYYKYIEIRRSGRGKAVNKYDVAERKRWSKNTFRTVLHGLFLAIPQPIDLGKVSRIVIASDYVEVKVGWADWQGFDVR